METWPVVVCGKGGATSNEVIRKVEQEVGPMSCVRVHELRHMRDGGAVIRAPMTMLVPCSSCSISEGAMLNGFHLRYDDRFTAPLSPGRTHAINMKGTELKILQLNGHTR